MGYLTDHLTGLNDREVVHKLWGWEEIVHNDDRYCGKILWYNGKVRSSLHRHLVKDEVLMVVRGVVNLEIQAPSGSLERAVLSEVRRDAVHIEPGVWHRLTPIGTAEVYEWSSSHNDEDVERLEPSQVLEGVEL